MLIELQRARGEVRGSLTLSRLRARAYPVLAHPMRATSATGS
jgi:hypothetical protein